MNIHSVGLFGMNAFPVTIEAEVTKGMPNFEISGLPDKGIQESRERVRSALASLEIPFPKGRVLMNLAPADVKKSGSSYDLAIFVALLQAMDQLRGVDLSDSVFAGELGLHGVVHPIKGVLSIAMLAREKGRKKVYIPAENVIEAAAIDGVEVYGIQTVKQLLWHLRGRAPLRPAPPTVLVADGSEEGMLDFCEVRGQQKARAGMELAAAGGHNILLVGVPGSGKSMLANRLPTILPEMTRDEMLETTNVYSVAGLLPKEHPLITHRPFRGPHHTISSAGLIGGGSIPAPGEISLAHNGVLFLDELPEFSRSTLEILRQPLEDRKVTIARAAGTAVYPCSIMLVAAMNPCPCGYYGSDQKPCTCTPRQVKDYLGRISGPLLDRFDLHIDVDDVKYEDLASGETPEDSATIRARVNEARDRQKRRFAGTNIYCNAMIPDRKMREYCELTDDAQALLKAAHSRFQMSARSYSRIQKVARSSADLHGHDKIEREDLAQAMQFRGFESKYLKLS